MESRRATHIFIGSCQLHVGVHREEDGGEGDVAKEARTGALVQAEEAELLQHRENVHLEDNVMWKFPSQPLFPEI